MEATEAIETRSRSRSKTPSKSLRVSSEKELNGNPEEGPNKKIKKSPNVTTIEEEETKESPQKSGARVTRKTKTATPSKEIEVSAQSSQSIASTKTEGNIRNATSFSTFSSTYTTTTSTSTISSTQKKEYSKSTDGNLTNAQQTTTKTIEEANQNEINKVIEDTQATMRTSTPKATSKKKFTSMIVSPPPPAAESSQNAGDLSPHAAYKEYKDAGEYWNKFPKTDFTYSELSPHRREIAPGVIAMPNMSRKSLEKHHDRVTSMISRSPGQESYIRERYAASKYSQSFAGGYDSQDEVDLSQFDKSRTYTRVTLTRETSIVKRFFLSIVTLFYSSIHAVSRVFKKSEHNLYYTRVEEERGFFKKIYSFLSSTTLSIFKRFYLLISSILFLDSWLLQSAAPTEAGSNKKKKFILGLLILLPFLLFGGTYLYLDPSVLDSLQIPKIPSLNDLNLNVDLEKVKISAYQSYDNAKEFSGYYLDNVKVFSQNTLAEMKKIWSENLNNLF